MERICQQVKTIDAVLQNNTKSADVPALSATRNQFCSPERIVPQLHRAPIPAASLQSDNTWCSAIQYLQQVFSQTRHGAVQYSTAQHDPVVQLCGMGCSGVG